jgi:hypothetical protein
MKVGLIMLVVPFVAMLIIVREGFLSPVCMPTETHYSYWQGCVACSNYMINGTRWDNTGVLQTISEMVARDDTTTEAFAAASAMAVIGIAFVVEQVCQLTPNAAVATALRASVFVGAGGMIGLTVWSMRVHGLLHSTFTALTIIAMLEQLIMCAVVLKWKAIFTAAIIVPPAAALVIYMNLYATSKATTWPGPSGVNCKEYFDVENFGHAKAQCAFVVLYFIDMAVISYMAESRGPAGQGQGWQHVAQGEFALRPRRKARAVQF